MRVLGLSRPSGVRAFMRHWHELVVLRLSGERLLLLSVQAFARRVLAKISCAGLVARAVGSHGVKGLSSVVDHDLDVVLDLVVDRRLLLMRVLLPLEVRFVLVLVLHFDVADVPLGRCLVSELRQHSRFFHGVSRLLELRTTSCSAHRLVRAHCLTWRQHHVHVLVGVDEAGWGFAGMSVLRVRERFEVVQALRSEIRHARSNFTLSLHARTLTLQKTRNVEAWLVVGVLLGRHHVPVGS